MSRTARIAGSLRLGYLYQLLTILVGLWLMPLLLRMLGQYELGLWLVIGQVLLYLGLMDLGVVALLSRDLALAVGEASGDDRSRSVIRESVRLVWFQTPFVAVVACGIWFGITYSRPELRGPLAVILIAFVALFPFRMATGILRGFQDIVFLGRVQIVSWVLTTALTVGLIYAKCGIYSLVIGWAVGQISAAGFAIIRVRRHLPISLLFLGHSPASQSSLRPRLIGSIWVSVQQLANVLMSGTDFILLGWFLGPTAVVMYAATSKLVSVVQHQPNSLMIFSVPVLGELRGTGDTERWNRAARAISTVSLMMSGLLCILIVAVNEIFVSRWMGPQYFGGMVLTCTILLAMLMRHWVLSMIVCLSSFGTERLIALAILADGCISVAAGAGLVVLFGPIGVPLGFIAGSAIGSLPAVIVALAQGMHVPVWQLVRWNFYLVVSFAAIFVPVFICAWTFRPLSIPEAAALAAVGALLFALALWPLFRREPLRSYVEHLNWPFRRRVENKA